MKEIKALNEIVYTTAKKRDTKRRYRNIFTNKKPAGKYQFQKKLKLLEVIYQNWTNCQK